MCLKATRMIEKNKEDERRAGASNTVAIFLGFHLKSVWPPSVPPIICLSRLGKRKVLSARKEKEEAQMYILRCVLGCVRWSVRPSVRPTHELSFRAHIQ